MLSHEYFESEEEQKSETELEEEDIKHCINSINSKKHSVANSWISKILQNSSS